MLVTALMLALAITAVGGPAEQRVAVSSPGDAGSQDSPQVDYAALRISP